MGFDAFNSALNEVTDQARQRNAQPIISLTNAYGLNPDDEARKLKLERQTGVLAPLLNDPEARQAAERQAFITNESVQNIPPATADYFTNPQNAAIAHDDVPTLSKIEQATSFLGKTKKFIDENVLRVPITQGYVQYQKGVGGMYQWIGDAMLQPLIETVTTDAMREEHGTSNFLSAWGKQMQAEANLVQGQISLEHPVDPNSWTGAIRGGMSSTFQQLPAMVAGGSLFMTAKGATTAVLGSMGAMTGGSTYGEMKDKGFSTGMASLAAAGNATVEIGTELIPTAKVFELLKPSAKMGMAAVFKKVGEIYGAELVGESVATFLQDVIDKSYDKPDMTPEQVLDKVSDYIASGEAWQNFKNTLKTTLVQTTVMAGSSAGINQVGQKVNDYRKGKADQAQQALEGVLSSVEASRLRDRSPESFAEFAQRAGEQHGVGTVYLQADRVMEEAQKAGWTQEQLVTWAEQYGVSQADLNVSLQTGGMLEMEFGKVIANMKTDGPLIAMQKDLTIDPNAHPVSRAADGVAAESDHHARLSELYQAEQDNLIAPDDVDQWKKDLLSQDGLKGRVTEQHLDLMAATANTYSKLSGMPAIDLLNKMLSKGGLQAIKFKDFQSVQAPAAKPEPVQIGEAAANWPARDEAITSIEKAAREAGVLSDTTERAYRSLAESAAALDGKEAVEPAHSAEALQYLQNDGWAQPDPEGAAQGRQATGPGSPLFERAKQIFDKAGVPRPGAAAPQASLYQTANDDPLGALQVEAMNVVSLFEKADKSTFLHESGHIFLNFLKEMAEVQGIQPEVWQAAKEWLEVGEDGVLTREQQERWAETFEVYLMEGTAPTPTLKTAFRSFKTWLTRIYESVRSRRAGARDTYSEATDKPGEKIIINPEIKAIFDKMLATEQEIQAMKEQAALVAMLDEKLLNSSGFTREQIDEYRRIAGQSEDQAKESRDSHKLKGFKERMAANRAQAATEAKEIPVYGLIEFLTDKGNPIPINKESIRAAFGEEMYKKLPNVTGLWSKDGMDINQLAAEHGERFGYESAADLTADLVSMQPLKLWIEKRVAQMEAAHDLSQDTADAIRTSGLRRMLEVESQWLALQSEKAEAKHAQKEKEYNEAWKEAEQKLSIAIAEGQLQAEIDDLTAAAKAAKEKMTGAFRKFKATALPREVIRTWASRVIDGRGIKEISNIGKLLAESRKHRQQAIALAKKGEWEGALKSNEQARLTEELISQSYKAQKDWQKMQRGWKNIAKWTNDNKDVKVGEDFRDQINRILAQYSIAKKDFNPTAMDLQVFVEQLAAADDSGMGTALAGWIGVDVSPASELSWSKLNDLNDALKFLYGHGRAEVEGLKTSKGEFINDIANTIVMSQAGLKGDKLKKLRSEAGVINKTIRAIQKKHRKFFANTAILRYIAQRVDGYANVGGNGTMGRGEHLIQDIISGMAEGNVRWTQIDAELQPVLRKLFTDRGKIYSNLVLPETFKRYGMVWTRERVVTACLNMGNASNLQRLMDGYGIDVTGVKALQQTLTAEEWRSIQKLWKEIDKLWPEISAVHKRVNFFSPKKIEAEAFTVETIDGQVVNLEGGYWPIAYDRSLDGDVAKWNEKDDILASSEAILQTPVAKSGFTKGRNEKVVRPLDLSLSVLSTHLSDTIKYITIAEKVRDADRVFRNKALAARNEETIGVDMQEMIRPALKHVLRPEPNIYGPFETGRVKMSAYYMAYNAWTALQNVTGVFPAIRATGFVNYTNGAWHVARGTLAAHAAMLEASKYMRLRQANIERDLKKQVRDFKIDGFEVNGKRYNLEDVQSIGWAGVRFIDTLVSLPAWWGKYNAEVEKHGDIQLAIDAADAAVNKALGSGLAIDATGIGRHKFFSLLAPFMSFASTQQEVLATETAAWKEGKMTTTDWLYGQMMIWILPAMMSTFLQGALMYGLVAALGGGDDDKKRRGMMDYATDLISYRLMGIPFVRDVFNAVTQGLENKAPITSARMPITEAYKMIQQLAFRVGNFADDANGKRTKALAWAVAELSSLASGIPATRIYQRWVKGTKQIESGDGWWMNHFVPQEKKK